MTIDRSTGKLANGGGNTRQEYFINGTQPTEYSVHDVGTTSWTTVKATNCFDQKPGKSPAFVLPRATFRAFIAPPCPQ